MSGEKEPMIPPPQPSTSADGAPFHESSRSSQLKIPQLMFMGLVVVMVLITVGLSIYRSLDVSGHGAMYLLLGINLIGFSILEVIMIILVYRGHLPAEKTWFLYFVGGAVILESIFTNVALFH